MGEVARSGSRHAVDEGRVSPLLRQMTDMLLEALGPQGWWPADSDEEVVVGAVLTQAVAWSNAARAVANLKAAGLCRLAPLAEARPEALAPLIRPAGYYNAKARKLVAVARFMQERGGLDALRRSALPELRRNLLQVYGIGPETADAILCYALRMPAFVADAYSRRVLGRMGLLPPEATRGYAAAAAWAERHLRGDAAWLGELHALLVAVGKKYCRPRAPRCPDCPLAGVCAFRRAAAAAVAQATTPTAARRGSGAYPGAARRR